MPAARSPPLDLPDVVKAVKRIFSSGSPASSARNGRAAPRARRQARGLPTGRSCRRRLRGERSYRGPVL